MGDYRQHTILAGTLGVLYAAGASMLAGVHWVYGTVAALIATLGGLLPDLDHPVGVEMKGFMGVLGVLTAGAVWHRLARGIPDLPFELHLWAAVLTYAFIRHWLRRAVARLMVHRGISHSLPTCAVWAAATYLYYPSDSTLIRVMMSAAVTLGFLSHLLLDEMVSVNLTGARVKRSFGTALKFWAPSLTATILMYSLLSFLAYKTVQDWPDRSLREVLADRPPPLRVPWDEVRSFGKVVKSRFGDPPPRYADPPKGQKINPSDLPRTEAAGPTGKRTDADRVARRDRQVGHH